MRYTMRRMAAATVAFSLAACGTTLWLNDPNAQLKAAYELNAGARGTTTLLSKQGRVTPEEAQVVLNISDESRVMLDLTKAAKVKCDAEEAAATSDAARQAIHARCASRTLANIKLARRVTDSAVEYLSEREANK